MTDLGMHATTRKLAVLMLLILASQTHAGVQAMTLTELMSVTEETVYARVVGSSVHRAKLDGQMVMYTRLTIVGESLRTGDPVSTDLVYIGSHDPAQEFMRSEMPETQDVRVGTEGVFFVGKAPSALGDSQIIYNLAGAYRIESAFGTKVLVGKGDGMAFPTNLRLHDVHRGVRDRHLALALARRTSTPQGEQR